MYQYLFIHSHIEQYLSSFQILSIITKSTLSIHVKIFSVFVCQRKCLSHHPFWRIISLDTESRLVAIFFQLFWYLTSCSFPCMVSKKKSDVMLIFFPLWVSVFQDFFLVIDFMQFEYEIPWCSFLYLTYLVLFELPGSAIWCLH